MSGAGAQDRRLVEHGAEPPGQVRIEQCLRGPGLAGQHRAEPIGDRGELLDGRGHLGFFGAARVQPGGDVGRYRVDPARLDHELAHGRHAAVRLGRGPRGQHELGTAEQRVLAIRQPGGAGVVGHTGHLDPPAAVRPDIAGHADRSITIDQGAALLDVQFDQMADPAQRLRVGTAILGPPARRAQSVGHAATVGVGEGQRPFGGQRAGDHPGAGAGDAEPGPFLVDEIDHADRQVGRERPGAQGIDRGERTDHAQRAVEACRRRARCPDASR